jgi:hypothetical protein
MHCINGVSSNPVEGELNLSAQKSDSNTNGLYFQTYIIILNYDEFQETKMGNQNP